MPKITIDNIDYELDSFTNEAKANLQMLQITEAEIQRLQARIAIAQTARQAYVNALKSALPSPLAQAMKSETLAVN